MSLLKSVIFNDRKSITNSVENYIDSYNRDRVLVIDGFTGVGKTRTTLDKIFSKDMFNIYLGPTHNLVDEVSNRYKINHIRGKKFECINETQLKLNTFCNNTNYFCKNSCPYFNNGCEYYHKIKDLFTYPQTWSGVHGHITNLFKKFTKENYGNIDINIIDESFFNSMINRQFIKKEQIERLMEITKYKPQIRLLEELTYLINNNDDYNENNIIKIVKNMNVELLEEESKELDRKIIDMYNSGENMKNIFNFTNTIKELYEYIERKENPKDFLYLNNKTVDILYHKYINQTGSTILLDATFNPELTRPFFPDNTKFEILKIPPIYSLDQNIWQFKGDKRNTYPINTLYRKNQLTSSFYYLCKFVDSIAKKHKDSEILVISRKIHRILDTIKDNVESDNVVYTHYGNFRGINEYEDCDVCILFGTPFPNPKHVDRISKMLGIKYKIYEKSLREGEMLQGIGRIRMFGKKCYVYILSSIPLFEKDANVIYMTPNAMLKTLDKKLKTSKTRYGQIYDQIENMVKNEEIIKKSEIFSRVRGENKLIREALFDLIKEGIVEEKPRRSKNGSRGRPISDIILC